MFLLNLFTGEIIFQGLIKGQGQLSKTTKLKEIKQTNQIALTFYVVLQTNKNIQ